MTATNQNCQCNNDAAFYSVHACVQNRLERTFVKQPSRVGLVRMSDAGLGISWVIRPFFSQWSLPSPGIFAFHSSTNVVHYQWKTSAVYSCQKQFKVAGHVKGEGLFLWSLYFRTTKTDGSRTALVHDEEHKALTMCHEYIKNAIKTSLDEWARREQSTELLTGTREITLKISMYIFMSDESDPVMDTLEKLYSEMNCWRLVQSRLLLQG